MKRVLITGKGSYIGTKVEEWLKKAGHEVDVLDMLDDGWKNYDFHGYDSVYHVAGIAHKKNVPDSLYEQVNHVLAVEVAKKAHAADVTQFIFMSSGAVYSQNDKKHRVLIVDENSALNPVTGYGISKKMAEEELLGSDFLGMKIAILRPPMVYGPGAKGNYNTLRNIALRMKTFPSVDNTRSMIYIDNLCEFIRLVIESESSGIFLPQNREYVNSSNLVKEIRLCHGKDTHLIKGLNWAIVFAGTLFDPINKAFGTFYYRREKEYYQGQYQIVDFTESIRKTEESSVEN